MISILREERLGFLYLLASSRFLRQNGPISQCPYFGCDVCVLETTDEPFFVAWQHEVSRSEPPLKKIVGSPEVMGRWPLTGISSLVE